MKTIHKYKIETEIINKVNSFEGAKFLCAGWDCYDDLCVWAEVDTDNLTKQFDILCLGTGWKLDSFYNEGKQINHIDSVVDKPYIWHIYWRE